MIEGYKKYIDEKEYYLEYNGILEEREKISGSIVGKIFREKQSGSNQII